MSHFDATLYLLILTLLVLLAAFFSCAETALMAVNRYRLRHRARMKKRYAMRALRLLKRPDRLLGAILIGNTFANMFASALATLLASHFWGDNMALLAAVAMAFVVLIFSEIAPKTLSAIYPDQVVRWVALPVQVILQLMYPLVWLANGVTNGLLKLFHVRIGSYAMEPLSRDELRSIVYESTGKISRQYQNMLLSILDLNKLSVDDVMVARNNIIGVDVEQPLATILKQINEFQSDWVPFYRQNTNQIMGVLHIRDVTRLLFTEPEMDKNTLIEALNEPYFVPEGTSLNIQLSYFQGSNNKIAFVVDEYGEVQGMLTLNDILEEIVGDFTSSVEMGKRIHLQPDDSYLVDGATTVREFNRVTEWELPLRGPRTLNGLIVEYLESLPHTGVAVLIGGYPVEIVQVKDNRVKLARIFPQLPNRFGPLVND